MVPREGLIDFPMKVVAGCGSRRDLGLRMKPALHKAVEVSWTWCLSAEGEEAMRAMSSRYWIVRGTFDWMGGGEEACE